MSLTTPMGIVTFWRMVGKGTKLFYFQGHSFSFSWVFISVLTLQKVCENVADDDHSQHCEWPLLGTFSQPI